MKKFIQFIIFSIVITTLFGSCSNSEDNDDGKKKVVSKITAKFIDNDGSKEVEVIETFTFNYTNDEVSRITNSKNNYTNYIYDGKKLLRITNSTDTANDDNSITNEYSENLLTKSISEEQISELFYDSNTKLSEVLTKYIGSDKKYSTKFYYLGNNVILTTSENFWDKTPELVTYKYDKGNSPFKNLNINFRLLIGGFNVSENNVIEATRGDEIFSYKIIYDSENFPLKSTGINKKTGKLWVEYIYEYIKI